MTISMESLVMIVCAILTGIIGFFLKKTMNDLRDIEITSIGTKEKLAVLENDHTNKHTAMSDKFKDLKESIDTLTVEIKRLTTKIKE